MELAAPGILERVTLSKREGADAVVIWDGHYPSVITSRDLVGIPVVGPGMASMYIASALAKGFSLLVQLPEVVGVAKRQVRDLGLEDRCVGIYSIGILVLELRKPESFERVRDLAVDSIEEGEADVVCFGCMALNDHAPRLSEALAESHLGAIVIYPGKAVIRFAELLGGIGPSHSNRSYPYPTKGVKFSP